MHRLCSASVSSSLRGFRALTKTTADGHLPRLMPRMQLSSVQSAPAFGSPATSPGGRRSLCAATSKEADAPWTSYNLNVNNGVDKKYEAKSFKELAKMPPGVLQGLAEGKADEALKALKVYTVEDLGKWRFYRAAKTIAALAACEQEGGRAESNLMNINSALDKQFERCSFKEMLALPPSALQGLADWTDGVLLGLGVKTIGDLAKWKYAHWAEAIAHAAELETEDFSHR